MNVRKIRRKCSVRGCKNTADVFLLSKNREMSNTIAICRDCMRAGLEATEGYTEPIKEKREDKPLFPHPELKVTLSSVIEKEPEPVEVIDAVTEDNKISVAEDTVTTMAEEEKSTIVTPRKRNNSKK